MCELGAAVFVVSALQRPLYARLPCFAVSYMFFWGVGLVWSSLDEE